MWLIVLSDQLPVVALVSFYLTNKLIGREPILKRDPKATLLRQINGGAYAVLNPVSQDYPPL